jgi:hypothetical protein
METPPKIKQKYYNMSNYGIQAVQENIAPDPRENCLLFDRKWSKMYGN